MNRLLGVGLTLSILAFAVPSSQVLANQQAAPAKRQVPPYSCPMHPEVKSKSPGKCPKCGMALRTQKRDPQPPGKSGATVTSNKEKNAVVASPMRIPDTPVYDQDGRQLRFYTDLVKGKTVAINFIFTTCTTICPPLTATFRRVQQQLGDLTARDIAMISVSVDPTTDVPARLKTFAAKFDAGPGWTFVTGSKPEIDLLLRALNAYVSARNDHSPMMVVGNDRTGYWTRTYGLAPATDIVKIVNEAAARSASPPVDGRTKTVESASAYSQELEVPMPVALAKRDKTPEGQIDRRASAGVAKLEGGEVGAAKRPAEDLRSESEVAASYFPNLTLITQDGKPVRFFDDMMKGKVVVINFMFTTCTGICPPMSANLAKVQEYLGDHVGRDVNIISITVDPAVDTPEVLKKYAGNYKAKPGWYFLTGKKANLDAVLYKLGGYVENKAEHNTFLIIGNEATGQWMKLFTMSKPTVIADAIVKMIPPQRD